MRDPVKNQTTTTLEDFIVSISASNSMTADIPLSESLASASILLSGWPVIWGTSLCVLDRRLTNSAATRTNSNVAIKVLRADAYGGKHDIFELDILQTISRISKKTVHPGREHVLGLLDYFRHNGPNALHVCYVFNVLGCHLGFQSAQFAKNRLPVVVVKEVARQLLLGLDFLHRECGIIHTGTPLSESFRRGIQSSIALACSDEPQNEILLTRWCRFEAHQYTTGAG